MATNNDLDDFFKKKDRKANKPKKQTGLLTNNEELLKQLVIVTSATSAFKENMDFDEEEDDEIAANNHHHHHRHKIIDEPNGIVENNEVINKSQSHLTSVNTKSKHTTKLSVQDNNHNINEQQTGAGQQDEWEEFEDSKSKYEQLRLKFSRGGGGGNDPNAYDDNEDNDDYYEDGHNQDGSTNENMNNLAGDDEQSSRNNRRREQQKDKPVWKLDQVNQSEPVPPNDTTDSHVDKADESTAQAKPAAAAAPASTSSVYRPPALRGNASVTVVSGVNQRPSKKEKPNLASTEEFPTLGAAVNKK